MEFEYAPEGDVPFDYSSINNDLSPFFNANFQRTIDQTSSASRTIWQTSHF